MKTTWEVADVRKPLISASRQLERGHKLVLDEKPRSSARMETQCRFERTGSLFTVRLWIPKGFHRQGWTRTASRKESLEDHTLRAHEKHACCLARY